MATFRSLAKFDLTRNFKLSSIIRIDCYLGWTNFNPRRCLSGAPSSSKPIYDYSLLRDKGDAKICLAREKMGFKTPPLYILRKSSIYLYESCTDTIDIAKFFQVLNFDDTFSSWFSITRWHVWMLASRCMADKINGETLRNELIKRMWEDVNNRMDKLFYMKRREKLKIVQNYYAEFNATLFGMDEGVLSDDIVLAGAIWRNIISMSERKFDPVLLEMMVLYTRVQSKHLSTISNNQLLFDGTFQWKPFEPLIMNASEQKQKIFSPSSSKIVQ